MKTRAEIMESVLEMHLGKQVTVNFDAGVTVGGDTAKIEGTIERLGLTGAWVLSSEIGDVVFTAHNVTAVTTIHLEGSDDVLDGTLLQ